MYLTDKVSVKSISEDGDPSWRQELKQDEKMMQSATIKLMELSIKETASIYNCIVQIPKYQ